MFPNTPIWVIWTSFAFLVFVVMPLTYEGPRTATLLVLRSWRRFLFGAWMLKVGRMGNIGFFIEFPSKTRLIFQMKMPPIRLVKSAPLEGHVQSGLPEISGTLTIVSPPLHRRVWNRPLGVIFGSFVYVMCLTISGLLVVNFEPDIGIPFLSVLYLLLGTVMAVQPIMLIILNPRALTWRAAVFLTLAVLTLTMPVIMREMLERL